MKIRLHIERLVLEGFSYGQRHALAGAIEQELTRLLQEQGLPSRLAAAAAPAGESPSASPMDAAGAEHSAATTTMARIDAGTARLKPGGGAETAGRTVAAQVFRGMSS